MRKLLAMTSIFLAVTVGILAAPTPAHALLTELVDGSFGEAGGGGGGGGGGGAATCNGASACDFLQFENGPIEDTDCYHYAYANDPNDEGHWVTGTTCSTFGWYAECEGSRNRFGFEWNSGGSCSW